MMLVPAAGKLSAQVDSTFDLYLLVGQSNMAGRGEITDKYKYTHDHVLMLDKSNQWLIAKHPLHFDKPAIVGVGPGLQFGISMSKESNGHKIGLIPCAVGGTSIDVWVPGGFDKSTNTHPYDDAMKRLSIAMQSGVIKGIIWLQGEADSNPEKAKDYLVKLQALIERFRQQAGNAQLPFVAGELGRYKPEYNNINKELEKLPSLVPYTAVASSKKLKDKGDKTHFDSHSAETYGKRFAKAMKKLQQGK